MTTTLGGPFEARKLRDGWWHLTGTVRGSAADAYVREAAANGADWLRNAALRTMTVEWRAGEVVLSAAEANGIRHLRARSVIVHEPLPRLYEALPLAGFDANARRFWQRVFRLMRIPGGRFLLRFLAGEKGRKRTAARG